MKNDTLRTAQGETCETCHADGGFRSWSSWEQKISPPGYSAIVCLSCRTIFPEWASCWLSNRQFLRALKRNDLSKHFTDPCTQDNCAFFIRSWAGRTAGEITSQSETQSEKCPYVTGCPTASIMHDFCVRGWSGIQHMAVPLSLDEDEYVGPVYVAETLSTHGSAQEVGKLFL